MLKNTRFQLLSVLAAGALPGYLTASGAADQLCAGGEPHSAQHKRNGRKEAEVNNTH
jgi:hypothetical protein